MIGISLLHGFCSFSFFLHGFVLSLFLIRFLFFFFSERVLAPHRVGCIRESHVCVEVTTRERSLRRCDNRSKCGVVQCYVVWCSVVQCSVVQCSVVQCSVVQCSVVLCSVVQCSVVQCSVVQCSVVQCSVVQCGVVQCTVLHCIVLYLIIIQ